MHRPAAGLLALYFVLGSACADPVGTGLEGLFIDGPTLEPARQFHPYSDTIPVSGGEPPYQWDVSLLGASLPPGLSFSPEGELSGVPESRGTWEFTVRVRSSDGKGARETVSLTVWPLRAPVLEPTESCSDYPGWAVATFEDPRLAEAVGGSATCDELAEVAVLSVHTDTIASLVGLQNLPALAHLDFHSTDSISDIGPLAELPHLFNVWMPGNAITDPSPLSGHQELTDLWLSRNQISDLGGLTDLPSLERLQLDNNQVSDVTPLADLTSLTVLTLDYNDIADVSALAGLPRLRGLGLSNNRVTDIAPLAVLPDLRGLGLAGNGLRDISPLGELPGFGSLQRLSLAGNGITDISPLEELTALTTLGLHRNELSNIEPLGSLTALTILGLAGNSLSDIAPIAELTDIRSLDLSDNRITDLSALGELTGLAYLDLSGNSDLTDIQPLLDNPALPVYTLWVDGFDLRDTSVPCDDIAALEDRGVWVQSDCP